MKEGRGGSWPYSKIEYRRDSGINASCSINTKKYRQSMSKPQFLLGFTVIFSRSDLRKEKNFREKRAMEWITYAS